MVREEAIQEMKTKLTDYVKQITELDRRAGHNMYKCPLCGSGNGSGRNHNGAFSITKDGLTWKCFSCNKSGDIFKLVEYYEGITDFKSQAERIADIFNLNNMFTTYTQYTSSTEYTKKTKVTESANTMSKKATFKSYIEQCKATAHLTDYFISRGFDENIVKRFSLGYDPAKDAIVIPYDSVGSYFITRSTKEKAFRKPKAEEAGAEPVYNKAALSYNAPCFVTESPIDAISLMVASEGKAQAIALGGTGSFKLIDQVKEKAPKSPLILCFDNDEPGQKAAREAAAELEKLGIYFLIASFTLDAYPENKRKDANDLFTGNIEQLKKDIKANLAIIDRQKEEAAAAEIAEHNQASGLERLKDFIGGIKEGANTSYTPTGFAELDRELDGGLYPGLYILGAISSLGKTTFMLQLADQIAEAGKDILYFSLEMGANELISKSISRHTYKLSKGNTAHAKTARGITTASRYAGYSSQEKEIINQAIGAYSKYASRLYYYEGIGDIGVNEIRSTIEKHKELTGNTPLIFIDYLQILAPYDMRASDKQNTDKAILELKRISRDFKTSVIGISSFNRDNYTSDASMQAFKESGAIEYGSDVLLAIQPQGMKPGTTATDQKDNAQLIHDCKKSEERYIEVKILKNRNGKTNGKAGFVYHSLFNCIETDSGFRPYTGEKTPFEVV